MSEEQEPKTIIPQDIRDRLREPFPAEAISQHPTKTFLSTIKAIYIVERLNDVFGIGGWLMLHTIVQDTDDYVSVSGQIHIGAPYNFFTTMQYGGHKKTGKNIEPSDGYKSAVTDCQSKCASYLEIGIDVFKGKVQHGHQEAKLKPEPKKRDYAGGDGKEKSPPERPSKQRYTGHRTGGARPSSGKTLSALSGKNKGPMPATTQQDKAFDQSCKAKGLSDPEKAAFKQFALSNHDGVESHESIGDLISHFESYLDNFIKSGVYNPDKKQGE